MKKFLTTNAKRSLITGVGGLMFIGLLAAGIFNFGDILKFSNTAQAQGQTESLLPQSERNFVCSNATLSGKYAVIGDGFVPNGPPPAPMVPFAETSLMTLDGAGNLSNKVTVSRNGQISRNIDPGTYTVNEDCTGTMTISISVPPFQLNFDLVVADLQGTQGKEFYFIATTPSTVTATAKRIQ